MCCFPFIILVPQTEWNFWTIFGGWRRGNAFIYCSRLTILLQVLRLYFTQIIKISSSYLQHQVITWVDVKLKYKNKLQFWFSQPAHKKLNLPTLSCAVPFLSIYQFYVKLSTNSPGRPSCTYLCISIPFGLYFSEEITLCYNYEFIFYQVDHPA